MSREMSRLGRCAFVLLCVAVVGSRGEQKKERGHPIKVEHWEGEKHNAAYDHEAVLGSTKEEEKFSGYTAEQSVKELAALVDRMDTDTDGFVTKKELTDWVTSSFNSLDKDELQGSMDVVDENQDGRLTWVEYLQMQHGYTEAELVDEMAADRKAGNERADEYRTIMEDKERFLAADSNRDGSLTLDEYDHLENPEKSESTRDFQTNETLAMFDANSDGKLNHDEYMDEGENRDEEEQKQAELDFRRYDINNDGFLDRAEIAEWVTPLDHGSAESEADHLMEESDADGDGKLTKEEIVAQYELWVGSQATNYGETIGHDPSEL